MTLKAIGELVGLERRRIWETSWVKGPVRSGYVSQVVASWLSGQLGSRIRQTYA